MFMPRRWPYITTAIIAVNLFLFLFTHVRLQQERDEYFEIESRTLSLVATHPQVQTTPAQQALVDAFRKTHQQDWELMTGLPAGSANSAEIEQEMTGLARRLDDFQRNSLTARFALFPPYHFALSSLTSNFLHRSWTNLIFNICFLWLVGGTLEDVWGRAIYASIAVFSCLLAVWAYALVYPDGLIPLFGSSGLVAALMGVYLIRFPKTTIEHGTAIWVVRPRLLRFSSPVYVVFPVWVLGLAFEGKSAGEATNAAYLAQGCAFAIGAVLGLVLWITGFENLVSQKIEADVAWSVDPLIATASEHLQRGDLDAAINAVNAQISQKPNSVEAHEMLVSLYFQKSNALIKYLHALEALCEVHLKAAYPEAAWQDYENYLKQGGQKMPADTWLQLARFAESQGDWQRTLTEYEELARAWPETRVSVLAMISAGRIHLQQFGHHEEAKKLYTAAQNSRVPHGDWDEVIRKGLEKAGGVATPKVEKH